MFLIAALLAVSGVGGWLLREATASASVEIQLDIFDSLAVAAAAQERYAMENDGRYSRSVDSLRRFGLAVPATIELSVEGVHDSRGTAFTSNYCIEARSASGELWHYEDNVGIEKGRCRSFWV